MKVTIELQCKDVENSQFNPYIKNIQYNTILRTANNINVKTAVTLPQLSDYKFEKMLLNKYKDIDIHSYEIDDSLYDDMGPRQPLVGRIL